MHPVDDRARLGAANNADFYEAVFRAHGLSYRRDPALFLTHDAPPPYYSNLTTLDPDATRRQYRAIAELKASRRPFSLKDGFCRLELAAHGFGVLFDASWVWAAPDAFDGGAPPRWERIETPAIAGGVGGGLGAPRLTLADGGSFPTPCSRPRNSPSSAAGPDRAWTPDASPTAPPPAPDCRTSSPPGSTTRCSARPPASPRRSRPASPSWAITAAPPSTR